MEDKPKEQGKQGMVRRMLAAIGGKRSRQELTAEEVLQHPVVQQMATRLQTLQQAVEGLPEAVGRAVAEATQKHTYRGPAYPVTDPLKDPKLATTGIDLKTQMGDAREKLGLPREVPEAPKKDENKKGETE